MIWIILAVVGWAINFAVILLSRMHHPAPSTIKYSWKDYVGWCIPYSTLFL